MLLGERWEESLAAIEAALDRLQSRIWTKLPVKVISVDPSGQRVAAQSLVKNMVRAPNQFGQRVWQPQSMPEMPMCHVKFPSGGGWTLTFPIAANDEGTVSFSSRCIDNWWALGGEQPPLATNGAGSLRMHNLSDGFFEPGGRSKPNELTNVSATSVQLRSDDGKTYISLDANNCRIQMANGYVNIDANGNLHVSGAVIAGYGGADQVGVQTHTHDGVLTGAAHTSKPDAGT